MNKHFTQDEWDALPYRDEMTRDPYAGEVVKSRSGSSVWIAGPDFTHNPQWDCYGAAIDVTPKEFLEKVLADYSKPGNFDVNDPVFAPYIGDGPHAEPYGLIRYLKMNKQEPEHGR